MAKTNPIDEQYWRELWSLYDNERGIEVQVKREHRLQQIKVALLAAVLLLFFSVPFIPGSLVDVDLGGKTLTTCEALTFEAFRLDSDIFSSITSDRAEAIQLYYWLCQFIYKWLGYGGAACLAYWLLFIDPYKKLRGHRGYREYLHDVVYEEPKNVVAFLKQTLGDNKYRWVGFFYTWCVGCGLCMLLEAAQWSWMAQRQYYWFSTAPAPVPPAVDSGVMPMLPIAMFFLLVINVAFALAIGLARPRTRGGARKKTAALAVIATCLLAVVLLAVLHADELRFFTTHVNEYSIGFPEDEIDKDYFVNFTALFWGLGIGISALAAWLMPLCCTTYQNARLRCIVDKAYRAVLERHENAWEHAPLRAKQERRARHRAFVRHVSAFELTFFFGLTLFALWGLYFYWGDYVGNDTIMYVGIGVMAFEVIWALFLSPVVHHKMEKDITYKGKGVAWVLSEDRGIGSWQKYWKAVGWFESKGIPDDKVERKKALDIAKHLVVFFIIMAVCILGSTDLLGSVLADVFSAETFNIKTGFAVVALLIFIFYAVEFGRLRTNIKLGKRGFEHKGGLSAVLLVAILAGLVCVLGGAVLALESIEVAFDDTDALVGDAVYPIALPILIIILYYTLIWPLCIRLSAKKSDRQFWKNWKLKHVDRLPEAERAEVIPVRRFVTILSLVFALWGCGMGMGESQVYVALAGMISVDVRIVTGAFAILYMIIAPLLLVYSTRILRFNDPKDPERGKKRVYAILFELFAAGLVVGIGFVFTQAISWKVGTVTFTSSVGESLSFMFAPQNAVNTAITLALAVAVLVAVVMGLALVCYPIFVRIDDLYKSIPDLLKIMLFGVILLGVWNYMCEWLFTTPRLHWSWKADLDPVVMRDEFQVGNFLAGVGGYFFWGWVQELLFLGYFCWLLYKIQPNKWMNAAMSSLLFMMFHWDNIALMVGTAIGGFMWALWWDQRRNLFMLGWMHGWNGTLVNKLIPMSMTVGPGAHD